MGSLHAFLPALNPNRDSIFPSSHIMTQDSNNVHFSIDLYLIFFPLIVPLPPESTPVWKLEAISPHSNSLLLMWRINLSCQYHISLRALSFIFLLNCLSLYFSDPFSSESFENVFLPTESLQLSAVRFCWLFFSSLCMLCLL